MNADPIFQTLLTTFGFQSFRDGQENIIRKLLEGKSALAVFPTGSGKSLCYQLPALHLPGVTLVISPLIALMKDQIDFLRGRGVAAARLDSSISLEEIRQIEADLEKGALKLLYVAPERFSNERFIHKLSRLKLSLMVIDEAHCISEWGHNFRPDYLKLARIARSLGLKQVLALTATATPGVARDICREFSIEPDAFVHTGFHRPNLELRVTGCSAAARTRILIERLKRRPPGAVIVYVTLQKTAESVAEELAAAGFPAQAYHAGLSSEEREAVQEKFMASHDAVVVATIAFGMGIDKSDIRYVYHYNLPKSLENYSQEIGRAGRDGAPSICEILAAGEDITVLENFTYGDTPEPAAVQRFVDFILDQPERFDISANELSRSFDVRPLVVGTLLTYLELADAIEVTSPFYSEYQFVPLKSSKEILASFDSERAAFLKEIFAKAKKAHKWFSLDLEEVAKQIGSTRERIVKALVYLEEKGMLTLKVAGLRQGYRLKSPPADRQAFKQTLTERFALREKNDIGRVGQVVELARYSGCIVGYLLRYFGETLEGDCGHCGTCLGDPGGIIERAEVTPSIDHAEISELRRRYPRVLVSARQCARFLCGLTSPGMTSAKLTRHPSYGSLGEVPFHRVVEVMQLD